MKYRIILTAERDRDSRAEIDHELAVMKDITGVQPRGGVLDGQNVAVFEGEFHEFYQRVKDRIMSKIKAYE